ncbi:MFS transporter [Deinococcus peraridilitoris]|uniref:MFS transporter n=1 Tax=Deinococcus peraridilitoris TaxID=432329 RepID=UPI0002E2AD49|nr:MFS transporter [Deinococcus peraridilitoris]
MTQPAEVVEAPGRYRALVALAVAVVLAMAPWFSAAAVLPQLRELWTLTPAEGAWLTLAVQLGFVVGAVLSAALNLADLLAPRRLILLGAVLAALGNALLLISTPEAAPWLRGVTGAALALVYPPALKAMSAWFRLDRGVALGVMVGALTLGSALPHLVNALGGADWRMVLGLTSLLAVVGGVLAARVPEGPHRFPPAVFQPRQAVRVLSTPTLRLTTLGYLGHMWELYAMWAWFAVFFADVLRDRALPGGPTAGLATFMVVGVGALGCYYGGVLGKRWGKARLTARAMLISGLCALGLALLVQAPAGVILAVSALWGFWIIADSAQFSTLTSELADPRYVGTALTLQLALGFSLTALSIAAVPVLQNAVGWRGVFLVLAVGPFLGALAMRRLERLQRAS